MSMLALVVDGGGKHLAGLHGNGGVARNDDVHQAAEGLDAERERRDIEQQNIFETARENFRLDGGAEGDGFVGVLRRVELRACTLVIFGAEAKVAARFLELRAAKPFRNELAHERHARLAADEDNLIEVFGLQFRVGERAQTMRARAHDDVAREILQFVARELVAEAEVRW